MERAAEHAPELRFLLDLVAAGLQRAAPSTSRDLDLDLLGALIRHHRLEPWATPLLSIGAFSPIHDTLRADLRRSATRRMSSANELCKLCQAFAAAGVPALAVKGPALSLQLFGDPLRRACRDLDFLVPRSAETAARRVLAAQGYGRTAADVSVETNAVTLHHAEKPPVELHVRLAELDLLFPLGPLAPFERPATLAFGHTMIPTLPVEAAVAYAAFHGARHQWSRLYWLADIAMACRLPGLDWDKVDTIARRTGTARHLALALDLARDWLGSPAMLPRATGRDREAIARSRALAVRMMAPPPCSDQEALARIGGRRLLAAELGLARGPARLAVLTARLQATSEDRQAIPLPPALGFLYPLVRIGRRLTRHRPGQDA